MVNTFNELGGIEKNDEHIKCYWAAMKKYDE